MASISVSDFCAAVKYVERKTGDSDLAQETALFAWERLGECRGRLRPWLLAIAWTIRAKSRLYLAREIDATERYATGVKAHGTAYQPDQEARVLARELALLPDVGVAMRPATGSAAVVRARRRVEALLAA